MDQKRNYQKELEKNLIQFEKEQCVPKLLLHSCCAPCSSYVLEYLSSYLSITVFYFNPNITDPAEYKHRVAEQKRFIEALPVKNPVCFLEGNYHPEDFFAMAKGLEAVKEGGSRCFSCYEMRLRETARIAKDQQFDYFTTTLSISPLKNAQKLNEIGEQLAKEYRIPYLNSDFKKKNGYQRSVALSAEYGLYRQDYCGCIFSKQEREAQKTEVQQTEVQQTEVQQTEAQQTEETRK